MSTITPAMASFASAVSLAADIDHVATFKSMISRRSERGRELHGYFDKIVGMYGAQEEFFMSHIHLLKQTLLHHNVPIPLPGSPLPLPHNSTSVNRKRSRAGITEDCNEQIRSSKQEERSDVFRQAPAPSSKERRRLAREIVYGNRHPDSVDIEMTSDEISKDEVRDISLMKTKSILAQLHEGTAPSDNTDSKDLTKPGQQSRKRMSSGPTPSPKRPELSRLSRSTEKSSSSSSSSSEEHPAPKRRYRLWNKSSPFRSGKSRLSLSSRSSATSSAPSSTPFSLLSDGPSDSTYQPTEMSDESVEQYRNSSSKCSYSESEPMDCDLNDSEYQADSDSEPKSRAGSVTSRRLASEASRHVGTAFQQEGAEAAVETLRTGHGTESKGSPEIDQSSGVPVVDEESGQAANVEQDCPMSLVELQSEADDSGVNSELLSEQHNARDINNLTQVNNESLFEGEEAVLIEGEPEDNESKISRCAEFEIFEDPLQTPPASPTLSQGGASTLAGGAELENQENIDPQHAIGAHRSDESRASRSGARAGPSQVEQIDPDLLRTFYHPGSDSADRQCHDTFDEAGNGSEGGDTEINDTEVNDTEANFTGANDPEANAAEPHDTERNSADVAIDSVEVKVEAEVEEFRFGSPTQSEIARVAPDYRAQIDVFVRGWARGVARAVAIEARAGPVLPTGSEISPDTESAAASSRRRTFYDSIEVAARAMGVAGSMLSTEPFSSDLESGSDRGYVTRKYPRLISDDQPEDRSEDEIEKRAKVARNPLRYVAAAPRFRYLSVSDPDELPCESLGEESPSESDVDFEDGSEDEIRKRATVTGHPLRNKAAAPRFRYLSVSDPDELPAESSGEKSASTLDRDSEHAGYRHANSEDETRVQGEFDTVGESDEEQIGSYRHAGSEEEARVQTEFETGTDSEHEVDRGYRHADSQDEARIGAEFLSGNGGELRQESEDGLGSAYDEAESQPGDKVEENLPGHDYSPYNTLQALVRGAQEEEYNALDTLHQFQESGIDYYDVRHRANLHETLVGHFLDPAVIDRLSNVVESGRVQGGAPGWTFDGVHYHYNQQEDLYHDEFLRGRINALRDRIEKHES